MPLNPTVIAAVQQAKSAAQAPATSIHPGVMQALLYALQARDATGSANWFAQNGKRDPIGGTFNAYETNPMMKPFSHGGMPMMALGFGLGDLLRHALLRHASAGARNSSDAAQALSNILGIMQTSRTAGSAAKP